MKIFNQESYKTIFPFLLLIGSVIFFIQYYAIAKLGENGILVLLGLISLFTIIILSISNNWNISLVFFVINLFPLIYLNNDFHYSFSLEILLSFPLILWILFAFFNYLYYSDELKINLTYLQKPILLFVLYSVITALIGFASNKSIIVIAREFFHVFYYLFAIVVYKYFNDKDYSSVFKFLLLLSVIISFEYIYINKFTSVNRFVTFQSGLLPIASTILFSAILFNIKRSTSIALLFIIVLGTFVTLTRTLWITTFISLASVLLLFLYYEKKTGLKTIIILLFLMLLPLLFITKYNKSSQASFTNQNVEDRTQSLAKPTEDHSFLMRAEIGLYVSQRFISSPIIGKGFGDYVRYKILGDTKANVIYPDSTYLYVLWKSGIIGFIIYMIIFWRFFKITFANYKNSNSITTKIISLGLLSAFIGLAFLNILSPLFIKYKSNIIIAFFLAYSDFQYNSNQRTKTI